MDATPEQWRSIPGYEGFYEVSDQGRVKSLARVVHCSNGKHLTLRERVLRDGNSGGYRSVVLCIHGTQKCYGVHRLVMKAFVGPSPEGMEVCHANGTPSDNRLVNLRYDTRSGNQQDRLRHGRHNMANRTHCIRGHALVSENLWINRKPYKRRCKECARAKQREYRRRRAEQAGTTYAPRGNYRSK